MKKIIALSVAIICMGTASAQQMALKKKGYFKPIPGYVTNDGKGRLIAINDDDDTNYEFTIINTELKDEASFTANAGYSTESSYREIAQKDITSLIKVADYSDSDGGYICSTSDFTTTVNSSETLAQALNQKYPWEEYAPCKINGYDICVVKTSYKYESFMNYDVYGEAFPRVFYTIKDGACVSIYRSHVLDTNEFQAYINKVRDFNDFTGLTFNKVEGSERNYEYDNEVIGLRLCSIDKGEGHVDNKNTYATQSLFNSDDKWEYLTEAYDSKYDAGSNTLRYNTNDTQLRYGILTVERQVYTDSNRPNCIKIMSQDGTCLGTMDVKHSENRGEDLDTYIIGGKLYIVVYSEELDESTPTEDLNGDGIVNDNDKRWIDYAYLYCYNGTSDGITLVEKTPAADNRAFNIAGQRITLNHKGIVVKNGKKILNK